MKDKTEALIGFAIKARKIVLGADNIEKHPRISLIICCETLAEKSLNRMLRLAGEKIPIIISHNLLEDIIYKQGVKAAAIVDKQMATAILQNLTKNYTLTKGYATDSADHTK